MPLSPKENLLRAIAHDGPEYVPYVAEGACRFVDYQGFRPPRSGKDEWGVTWAPLPSSYTAGDQEPSESYAAAHPAEDVTSLLRLPFPCGVDPAQFSGIMDGIDAEQVLAIGRHPAGLLDRFGSLIGVPQALVSLIREPEASYQVLNHIVEYHISVAQSYLAAGAEAALLADDYAGQAGPYIKPSMWRELILPGLQRIIAVYRKVGAPVFFHTCGRSEEFLPDLIEAGVTVFNLESCACDLAAVKARFGRRISFIGGVSVHTMTCGTPQDVEEAAEAAIATLWKDGGLILGPDQWMVFPKENEAALAAAACRHRRRNGATPEAPRQ